MDLLIGHVVLDIPYLWTRFARTYLVLEESPKHRGLLLPPELLGNTKQFFQTQTTEVPVHRFSELRLNGSRTKIEHRSPNAGRSVASLLTELHVARALPSISEFRFLPPAVFPRLLVDPVRALLKASFPPVRGYTQLKLTDVGIYSVSRWKDSRLIGRTIQDFIGLDPGKWRVTETCAGVGGDAIELSRRFAHVTAVELIPLHCAVVAHNIQLYRRQNRVRILCANYVDVCGFYRRWNGHPVLQEVIYFDPPWGGPNYGQQKLVHLSLDGVPVSKLVRHLFCQKQALYVFVKAPTNVALSDFPAFHCVNVGRFKLICMRAPSVDPAAQ